MVINNRGPSQSALEHYVEYFLKDCGKVWQWSCPAHLRQRLASNLQETSIGAGVIKSSPRDKVADWPCSNCWEAASCCSVFAFLPHASSLHLELPQHAGMAEGWQVGCGAGKVLGSISSLYSMGGPGGCFGSSSDWQTWGNKQEGPEIDLTGQCGHNHRSPTAVSLCSAQYRKRPQPFICSVGLPTQPSSLNTLIP